MKTVFKNLLKACGVILYFIVLIFAYTRMDAGRLMEDIKVFSGAYLVVGILLIEKAYKNDNGKTAITGIELLALSMHSLSILQIMKIMKYDFKYYLIGSAVVITIYYLIKGIVISIKENRDYLNNLSDVAEIVKKDEPVKKEAKKRNTTETKSESKVTEKKDDTQLKKKVATKKKNKGATNKTTPKAKTKASQKKQ